MHESVSIPADPDSVLKPPTKLLKERIFPRFQGRYDAALGATVQTVY